MTAFDIAVIGIILFSAVFAYWRGFVREALSIAAWVLAAVVAYYAYPYALPIGERFLPKGAFANIATGAVVFLVALAMLHIVAKAIASRVQHSALSPLDRTFGLLFGVARGVVLACIAYMAIARFVPAEEDQPRWFAKSRTIPYLEAGAEQLESLFSRSLRTKTPRRITVEKEAEKAISAFTNPAAKSATGDAPAYTPDEKRELNRLIEQQNAQ